MARTGSKAAIRKAAANLEARREVARRAKAPTRWLRHAEAAKAEATLDRAIRDRRARTL
jgi:hypothetical protein